MVLIASGVCVTKETIVVVIAGETYCDVLVVPGEGTTVLSVVDLFVTSVATTVFVVLDIVGLNSACLLLDNVRTVFDRVGLLLSCTVLECSGFGENLVVFNVGEVPRCGSTVDCLV